MTATRAAVAVVAHPDDESLIAGGTLALAARAGTPTGVVALTRGELGPVSDPALLAGRDLGAVREGELHAAAEVLGVQWACCLTLPDGELAWVDAPAAAAALADVLAPHAPAALLTFGEDGLYGHPDHAATADIAALAGALLPQAPAVFAATWPCGLVSELTAAAAARGLGHDLWGLEADAFGCEREPAVTVDVGDVLQRKLMAIRAHRSQIGRDHLLAELPDDLAQRFLAHEPWSGGPVEVLEGLLRGA